MRNGDGSAGPEIEHEHAEGTEESIAPAKWIGKAAGGNGLKANRTARFFLLTGSPIGRPSVFGAIE